jgi:hypothetical protein
MATSHPERIQGSARHAQASTNRVVETGGGVGASDRPEHEGPEQGAGRRGPSVPGASSGSDTAGMRIDGSSVPTASPSAALWIT